MTEFGFISKIKYLFGNIETGDIQGIGDDCAIMPLGEGESLVFTTDMLVEDIHFLRNSTSAFELGGKSLAVNLSDIAAMGATPTATLLSLSLPAEVTTEWADEFMRGYHALSTKHNVALIGGDTTGSKRGVVINVTAIGRIKNTNIKHRADAKVGDTIFVGDRLGASGDGLKDILNGDFNTDNAKIHLNPQPQIEEGKWLGAHEEVHAMMDISDGVASDIRHIMEQSHLGATIDIDRIPTDVDFKTAATAGEDYKLLFTVREGAADNLIEEFEDKFGYRIYPIGIITQSSELVWRVDGEVEDLDWNGFRHY